MDSFLWIVCQTQLLQDLASADSIRQAITSSPLDLPATFCRILEKVNDENPSAVQVFIQRALNWLVWGPPLHMEEFVHMLCMHDEIQDFNPEDVPEPDSVLRWLGCLVRLNKGRLELAHASIREFLVNARNSQSRDLVNNPDIQKYLMPESERFGPALACFSYLGLPKMTEMQFDPSDSTSMESFSKRFPFYSHAATRVIEHAATYDPQSEPPQLRRLFDNSAPQSLHLWLQYAAHFQRVELDRTGSKGWPLSERSGDANSRASPLHVACELRLFKTVSRSLSEGTDPNIQLAQCPTPLHRVVDPTSNGPLGYNENAHLYYSYDHAFDPRTLRIIACLLEAKADVNKTCRYADSRMIGRRSKHHSCCSPLYIAIWYRLHHVCEILLDYGAMLIADLPALRRLAANFEADHTKSVSGTWVSIFDRALRQATYEPEVQAILKALKVKATPTRLDNASWSGYWGPESPTYSSDSADNPHILEERFLPSVQGCDLDPAAWFTAKGPKLTAEDEKDRNDLMLSVLTHTRPSKEVIRTLKILEKAGANLAATFQGRNAVHYAMANGDLATLEYLESRGIDIDTEDRVGERPLHIAIHQHFEAGVDFILRKKMIADTINRASDHCGTPLYCAAKEGNIDLVEKLLCAGAMVNAVVLPGNTLGPALYVACAEGHARLVRVLLSHGADTNVKTSRYGNAMEIAKAFEQKEVIEVLSGYGRSEVVGIIPPQRSDAGGHI